MVKYHGFPNSINGREIPLQKGELEILLGKYCTLILCQVNKTCREHEGGRGGGGRGGEGEAGRRGVKI